MLLMLAVLMMIVARSSALKSNDRSLVLPPIRHGRSGRGLPVFALGIALALLSIPGGAWASTAAAPAANGQIAGGPALVEGGATPSAKTGSASVADGYAAREVKARGLEKFEGGDTTVVIGGSALVIIIIVILILVLI